MHSVTLDASDVKIAGHAINWLLNVPFDNIVPPHLTDHDRSNLKLLLAMFIEVISKDSRSVQLEITEELQLVGDHMFIPMRHYSLVLMALKAFAEENASSPMEVEIVTGFPPSHLVDLLDRLAKKRYQEPI